MKLLLSSVLLASLCSPSSWSLSSQRLVVTQSPDVSVTEGGAVNISCCWTGEYEKMRVKWLKNQTEIKSHSQESMAQKTSDCFNLTFIKITWEDSGRYTCRVTQEIPTLSVVNGSGTVITVRAREDTEDGAAGGSPGAGSNSSPLSLPVIISLAVAAPLLLITVICLCTLRRRQVSAQAARVIYEVPHTDSEEAEMDKHSTSSSRGSSQWCQVPVYESFDYFERVENKESG
ncbi:uncharacterized protein [Pempheris klunzingeri]|uniref:uncharacterized protein n=1 Tax=Pempheris klunzingeri TaxID=3127111 RepID=UPI003980D275